MSAFYNNPKLSAARTARREALTQRFPKLAERMKPFWDAYDKKFGVQSPDGGGAQSTPAATSSSLGSAPPLPQAGGRTSKTLLGS